VLAVSFDLWDTLLGIRPFFARIAKEIVAFSGGDPGALYGRILDSYEVVRERRMAGRIRAREIVEESLRIASEGIGVEPELLRRAVCRTVLEVRPEELLVEGAAEAVRELHRRGRRLAILSNVIYWPGAYNRLLLEKAGIGGCFVAQLYADEIRCVKPSRRAFAALCERLKIGPRELVHVGDSEPEDFEGALCFGAYGILVDPTLGKRFEVGRMGVVVRSVGDVVAVVELLEERGAPPRAGGPKGKRK